jgi:hypothetical protein
VETTSATLKGSVNPHGSETTYIFQYGESAAYQFQTTATPVGAVTEEVKVSQAITGLLSYTTYHFRVVATNAFGTSYGQDATFTTKKIPLSFKISVTPDPVVFGSPVTVRGLLSGSEAAREAVLLQASPFPFLGGFKSTAGPLSTDAGGNFAFTVADLAQNTEFRVITDSSPEAKSQPALERVAPRVSLQVSSTDRPHVVRLYGTVEPAEPGASIAFQLLRPGTESIIVSGTKAKRVAAGKSHFSRVLHISHGGLYRVLVSIHNGKLVSGRSRIVRIK